MKLISQSGSRVRNINQKLASQSTRLYLCKGEVKLSRLGAVITIVVTEVLMVEV